jgi:alpha-L-rhamnosidase
MRQICRLIFIITALTASGKASGNDLVVNNLKCNFMTAPKGLEDRDPAFSWEIHSERRNVRQAAYQLLIASSPEGLAAGKADVWQGEMMSSGQSVNVRLGGLDLESAGTYYWKVRVKDASGVTSAYSEPAHFETGILAPGEWEAEWIHAPGMEKGACPWFRKTFELEDIPAGARAFVGSVGYHELYVNGERAGDAVLTPSVSDLRKRALYHSYDITPYLKLGKNAVVIWLAPGWTGFRDFNPQVEFRRDKKSCCIAQIYLDGEVKVCTDPAWRCAPSDTWHLGRWQNSDFGGDSVNAMLTPPGWGLPEFDDSPWKQAVRHDPQLILSPDFIEPNRMVKSIPAREIIALSPGKYQVVMDKLYTGWIEVSLRGEPGQKVTLSASAHREKEVEFNQRNVYVIGPEGAGKFRNRFSYHEIAYVTVEGLEKRPETEDITGYQVTNDRRVTGGFDCSDTLIRLIYEITRYNYENLSTGGMTVDCPHRERLGYGGDGHGSLEIALDAYASHPFFSKWAQDWMDNQDGNGRINHTAPTLGGGGGPAWSGFIITMPWEVYQSTGDLRFLASTYPAAERWLAYMARQVGEGGLLGIPSPGDWKYAGGKRWLFLGDWATPHGSEESDTPEAALFNNCYYVYVLKLAANMAALLGKPAEARSFREQADLVTRAINETFLDPASATYLDTRQTHCVMPLIAGVVPPGYTGTVEANLEREIRVNRQGHFDTGIHGTYYLVKYLTELGRSDLIRTMASQPGYPGYEFFISRGYVTWPEYWHECNSIMHGCLNGIGGWFQRGLAGIRPDPASPGYGNTLIKPAVIDGLEWVAAYHDSPYGRIVCDWKKAVGNLEVRIRVPANASATVYLPGVEAAAVREGDRPLKQAEGVEFLGLKDACAVCRIGSGEYNFIVMNKGQKK